MAKSTKTQRIAIERCPKKASDHRPQKLEKTHSWTSVRGILSCRDQNPKQQVIEMKPIEEPVSGGSATASKKCKKVKCSGSLCSNTRIMNRPLETSPQSTSSTPNGSGAHRKRSLSSVISSSSCSASASAPSSLSASFNSSATTSVGAGSYRGGGNRMNLRRFSGCYECRMVVDPIVTRDPSLRSTICSCPECGEIFMKPERLELHEAIKHAGNNDSSFNDAQISWGSSFFSLFL